MIGRVFAISLALGTATLDLDVYAAGPNTGTRVKLVNPTKTELALIRRTLSGVFQGGTMTYAQEAPFSVGHTDLNGDGRGDLIVMSNGRDACGTEGCAISVILSALPGHAPKGFDTSVIALDPIFVLPGMHSGLHDLRFGDGTYVFKFNGKSYD